MLKREKLIEAMMRIREGLCAYGAPHGKRCDCKFGVADGPRVKGKFPRGSENGSGCPEMYNAITILQHMSAAEFGLYAQCNMNGKTAITASELRDKGVGVPIGVPDQAWVHKEAVQARAVLTEPEERDDGYAEMFGSEVEIKFTEPFRWFEPKAAGQTVTIPCLSDEDE